MARVLIIEARFYDHIADGLLAGARAVLDKAGVPHEILVVPGIFELPAALKLVLTAAEQGNKSARYDGFVTLGCAIRGESDHYHHVGSECMRGIADLSMEMGTPIGAQGLIVNRVPGGVLPAGVAAEVDATGLPLVGVFPMDENVAAMDAGGIAIGDIPADAPVRVGVGNLMEKITSLCQSK